MTSFRVAILAALLAPSPSFAGPIAWSYTSTSTGWYTDSNVAWYNINSVGVSGVGYGIDPASGTFLTALGDTQVMNLFNGWSSPSLVSPIPFKGPTLWTRVEMMHIASGESFSFRVPLEFYDNEPASLGEWDRHVPRVGYFPPGEFVLGRNKFQVTKGPEMALNVNISETPEPTTLLMAVSGMAGIGFVRRRIG